MNKNDLINIVAKKSMSSFKQTEEAVNLIFDEISELMKEKEKVTLVGLGTFRTSERSARGGSNPYNGEKIYITERTVPVFKVGKRLKERVK